MEINQIVGLICIVGGLIMIIVGLKMKNKQKPQGEKNRFYETIVKKE